MKKSEEKKPSIYDLDENDIEVEGSEDVAPSSIYDLDENDIEVEDDSSVYDLDDDEVLEEIDPKFSDKANTIKATQLAANVTGKGLKVGANYAIKKNSVITPQMEKMMTEDIIDYKTARGLDEIAEDVGTQIQGLENFGKSKADEAADILRQGIPAEDIDTRISSNLGDIAIRPDVEAPNLIETKDVKLKQSTVLDSSIQESQSRITDAQERIQGSKVLDHSEKNLISIERKDLNKKVRDVNSHIRDIDSELKKLENLGPDYTYRQEILSEKKSKLNKEKDSLLGALDDVDRKKSKLYLESLGNNGALKKSITEEKAKLKKYLSEKTEIDKSLNKINSIEASNFKKTIQEAAQLNLSKKQRATLNEFMQRVEGTKLPKGQALLEMISEYESLSGDDSMARLLRDSLRSTDIGEEHNILKKLSHESMNLKEGIMKNTGINADYDPLTKENILVTPKSIEQKITDVGLLQSEENITKSEIKDLVKDQNNKAIMKKVNKLPSNMSFDELNYYMENDEALAKALSQDGMSGVDRIKNRVSSVKATKKQIAELESYVKIDPNARGELLEGSSKPLKDIINNAPEDITFAELRKRVEVVGDNKMFKEFEALSRPMVASPISKEIPYSTIKKMVKEGKNISYSDYNMMRKPAEAISGGKLSMVADIIRGQASKIHESQIIRKGDEYARKAAKAAKAAGKLSDDVTETVLKKTGITKVAKGIEDIGSTVLDKSGTKKVAKAAGDFIGKIANSALSKTGRKAAIKTFLKTTGKGVLKALPVAGQGLAAYLTYKEAIDSGADETEALKMAGMEAINISFIPTEILYGTAKDYKDFMRHATEFHHVAEAEEKAEENYEESQAKRDLQKFLDNKDKKKQSKAEDIKTSNTIYKKYAELKGIELPENYVEKIEGDETSQAQARFAVQPQLRRLSEQAARDYLKKNKKKLS